MDALSSELDEWISRLYIHYDVNEHHLNIDTYIATAASARKILETLDKAVFEGGLGIEVIVLPPREGTFLQLLGVHPKKKLSVALLFAWMCTAQGEAFTKGLTGQTTSEWFEELGVALREGIDLIAEGQSAKRAAWFEEQERAAQPLVGSAAICELGTRIVVSMARGILELGSDALNQVGLDTGDLPDALDARAEFYEACYNDSDVKRIGFTPHDDFPIPRHAFAERAVKPVRKRGDVDEPEWVLSIENIYVNSPNWDEDRQRTRKWQGVDSGRRDCFFVIEDAEFWGRIRRKELHFEGLDSFKVQWACQLIDGKPKNRRVLRVLTFNGLELAEPLSSDAIKAILGDYEEHSPYRGGPSLFDGL